MGPIRRRHPRQGTLSPFRLPELALRLLRPPERDAGAGGKALDRRRVHARAQAGSGRGARVSVSRSQLGWREDKIKMDQIERWLENALDAKARPLGVLLPILEALKQAGLVTLNYKTSTRDDSATNGAPTVGAFIDPGDPLARRPLSVTKPRRVRGNSERARPRRLGGGHGARGLRAPGPQTVGVGGDAGAGNGGGD